MRQQLLDRWREIPPGYSGSPELGSRLLEGYGSPSRHYHDLRHLAEVLDAVDTLEAHANNPLAVRLAAWFHDAVYDPARPQDNERLSAELARRELGQHRARAELADEVARLVLLTAGHDPAPGDRDGEVLCDADLTILGAAPDRYAEYARAIRREYSAVPEQRFRSGRSAILRGLLQRPSIFRTATGRDRWERQARANLSAEMAALSGH